MNHLKCVFLLLLILPINLYANEFDTNLLVNGSAESSLGSNDPSIIASPEFWNSGSDNSTATSLRYDIDGLLQRSSLGVQNRFGNSYFAGGTSSLSVSTQDIDISEISNALENNNRTVFADFRAAIGGLDDQTDNATVSAFFKDSEGRVIDFTVLGPVMPEDRMNQTALLTRSSYTEVPADAQSVTVEIVHGGGDGALNDAYVDDVSLRLRSIRRTRRIVPRRPEAMVNGQDLIYNLQNFGSDAEYRVLLIRRNRRGVIRERIRMRENMPYGSALNLTRGFWSMRYRVVTDEKTERSRVRRFRIFKNQ